MQQIAVKWLVVAAATTGLNASVLAQDLDAGKTEYLAGCAACHGIDGKGKGPLSADLKTAPADLSIIAKRNGGVFSPQGGVRDC
jgi:mono/diheme cytochrome c family protein